MNRIFERIKANWQQKVLFSAGLTFSFMMGYLCLQRYPVFPVTEMTRCILDRQMPFWPGAVYLYESLWLFMPIAPWLMATRKELCRYGSGVVLVMLVGFTVFFFFPTEISRPASVEQSNVLYRALVKVDNELNAFPSLHSAFAFYHAAWCQLVFRGERWYPWLSLLAWLWALAIVISTLLTKQHVLVDAVAGALLGLGCFAICYWRQKRERAG